MDESGTPEKRDHLDGWFGMSTQHSKKNTEIVIQSLACWWSTTISTGAG